MIPVSVIIPTRNEAANIQRIGRNVLHPRTSILSRHYPLTISVGRLVKMEGTIMKSYDEQTINSLNPLARFAHRHRVKKSIELTLPLLENGTVLDYGCGSGVFVGALQALRPGCAVGYEPFMKERSQGNLPVYSKLEDVEKLGPYKLITLFETIEHLSKEEIDNFLGVCERLLPTAGGILISGPIEIGPALFLKELNRYISSFKLSDMSLMEILKAGLLGIPARRASNIKISHKGFDFRSAISYLNSRGWSTKILLYGPLPIGTWYGNSQVYLWANKSMK
jgi:SAM-dependent methyltransferase